MRDYSEKWTEGLKQELQDYSDTENNGILDISTPGVFPKNYLDTPTPVSPPAVFPQATPLANQQQRQQQEPGTWDKIISGIGKIVDLGGSLVKDTKKPQFQPRQRALTPRQMQMLQQQIYQPKSRIPTWVWIAAGLGAVYFIARR